MWWHVPIIPATWEAEAENCLKANIQEPKKNPKGVVNVRGRSKDKYRARNPRKRDRKKQTNRKW